jgi:type VI secretion system secreted protein VgrG
MAYQGEKRYTFISDAKAADTFAVVRFSGHEAISQPYRFEIELATEDIEIDLRAMLQKPARFVIHRDNLDDRVFGGVLAEFEQTQESGGHALYKAVLVPRLWTAGLYHENQLFLDKSVKDIITEVLQQIRLTGEDYALRLTGAYAPWEYLCQWRETDLNFIHRWMEREGIYYYFSQEEQKEKMIITDSAASHQPICESCQIPYSPPSATAPRHQEVIHSMVCRQQRLPNKVILGDYNYRRPSLELKAEAVVDAAGQGEVYFYGDHFKTPEEGSHLATVRAQDLLCRERLYNGESTAANLSAGYLFHMQDHYRESDNQQYLVIEVHHQGHQTMAGLSGQHSELSDGEKEADYMNRFTAIPASVQFRPEQNAAKPKFYGTLNATVDAAGSGEYAEIDDQGRYKVIMPFDRSGISGGRASRWVRMAQPYAGSGYGMHFPLHSGTEVLLTFVDGDPDRPIIAGSVPNPETASPVSTANQTQSMIRTGGGNQLRLEDNAGGQQIHLSSPTESSVISLGAPNKGNLYLKTDGTSVQEVGLDSTREIEGSENTTIEGDSTYTVDGNETITVKEGDRTVKVLNGKETIEVKKDRAITVLEGNQDITVSKGDRTINVLDGKQDITVQKDRTITVKEGKEIIDIKGEVEHTYQSSLTTTVTGSIDIESEESYLKIKAPDEICLTVGDKAGELKIKSDGTIELTGLNLTIDGKTVTIKGEKITSDATETNTQKGPTVSLEAVDTVSIQGGTIKLN